MANSAAAPSGTLTRRKPSQRELAGRQVSTLLYLPLLFAAVFFEMPTSLAVTLLVVALFVAFAGLQFGPKLMRNASKETVQRAYLGANFVLPLIFGVLAGFVLPNATNGVRLLFVVLLAALLATSYFSIRQFNKLEL